MSGIVIDGRLTLEQECMRKLGMPQILSHIIVG